VCRCGDHAGDAGEDDQRVAHGQALLLPLMFGLSLDDTSVAVGRSNNWTLRLRKRFGRIQSGQEQPKTEQGLRNRARMTLEEAADVLAPYLEQAKEGGVIVVPPLKAKLEDAVGRSLAISTVYAMLHRHGWRKLDPTSSTPNQARWRRRRGKTTPRSDHPSRRGLRQARTAEAPVPGRGAIWLHLAHTILLVSEAVSPTHARHGDPGVYLCVCRGLTRRRRP